MLITSDRTASTRLPSLSISIERSKSRSRSAAECCTYTFGFCSYEKRRRTESVSIRRRGKREATSARLSHTAASQWGGAMAMLLIAMQTQPIGSADRSTGHAGLRTECSRTECSRLDRLHLLCSVLLCYALCKFTRKVLEQYYISV